MTTKFSTFFQDWEDATKSQFNLTTLKLSFIRDTINNQNWPTVLTDLEGIEDSKLFMDCIRYLEINQPNLIEDVKKKDRSNWSDLEIQLLKVINFLPKHYTKEDAMMTFSNLMESFVGEGKTYEFTQSVLPPDMERSEFKSYDEVLLEAINWMNYKNFLPREVQNSSETVCLHNETECKMLEELKSNPYAAGSIPVHHLTQFSKRQTTTLGGLLLESIYNVIDSIKRQLNNSPEILNLMNYKRFEIDSVKEATINMKINNGINLNEEEYIYYKQCLIKKSLSPSEIYSPQDIEDLLRRLCRADDNLNAMVNSITKTVKLLKFTNDNKSNVKWIDLHIFCFKAYYYYYILFEKCPSPDPTKNIRDLLPLTQRKIDIKSSSFFKRYDFIAKFFSNNDLSEGKKNSFLNFPIDNFMFYEYARILGIAPCSRLFTCLNYLIALTPEIDIPYLRAIGLSDIDILAISIIFNAVSTSEIHYIFNYHRHCSYRDPKHFNIAGLVATIIEVILSRGKDLNLFRANFNNWCEHMNFANYDTLTYLHNDFISDENRIMIHKTTDIEWTRGTPIFDIQNFVNLVYGLIVESLEGVKRIKSLFTDNIMNNLADIYGLNKDNIDKDRTFWETLRSSDFDTYNTTKVNHNNLMVFKVFNEEEYNDIGAKLIELFDEGFEKERVKKIYSDRQDASIKLKDFHLVDYDRENIVEDFNNGDDENDENDDNPPPNNNDGSSETRYDNILNMFKNKFSKKRGNKNYTQEERLKYKETIESNGWTVENGTINDPDGLTYYDDNKILIKVNEYFELLDKEGNIMKDELGRYKRFNIPTKISSNFYGHYFLPNGIIYKCDDDKPIRISYTGYILTDDGHYYRPLTKITPYEVNRDDKGYLYDKKPGDIVPNIKVDSDGFVLDSNDNKILNEDNFTYKRELLRYEFPADLKKIREDNKN